MNIPKLKAELSQFTGTEHYYKNFTGLLYTDGITEAKNEADEQFGVARLIEAIKEASDSSAGDVAHSIILAVTDHAGGQLPDDDMTLLIFSF